MVDDELSSVCNIIIGAVADSSKGNEVFKLLRFYKCGCKLKIEEILTMEKSMGLGC